MKYHRAIFHRIPLRLSQYSHSQLPLLVNIFLYWLRKLAKSTRTCIAPAHEANMIKYCKLNAYPGGSTQKVESLRFNFSHLTQEKKFL